VENKVVDKRSTPDRYCTRRRRACLNCERRFTTYERIEFGPKMVRKKDGNRESFEREKLKKGIMIACQKRPVSAQDIEGLIDRVESELRAKDDSGEILSNEIGDLVMEELKKIDKVAYIRFASVYRKFADLQEFQKELSKLKKNK
jgi:transcriptional repressor NrdR